ncbi:hypothetical protein [Burkholderia contaminans]|uniref:hypothetical protein n=1 Tax=Burkholderia contaminans TaxID=488447 RepID=UPI001454B06E|nr:hypothetical protein [Burkholderia contaminans]MCA8157516.1 hypothetical protein [Burkholderia contaminans]VWD55128.1 hypothetical protein BCO19218_06552 [Burkholderia contaminans]
MKKLGFAAGLKLRGNVNRLTEILEVGTAEDAQACFASGGIALTIVGRDFPLIANLPELSRKALSKETVADFLSSKGGLAPMPT